MARPDWHGLVQLLGPQRGATRDAELAVKIEDLRCHSCGKRRRVGRVTRGGVFCVSCAPAQPDEPEAGIRVGGVRIETLVWQAHAVFERLSSRRQWGSRPYEYPRLDRLRLRAYRRFWRRKRRWLTGA